MWWLDDAVYLDVEDEKCCTFVIETTRSTVEAGIEYYSIFVCYLMCGG